jgi:hypothetical protein
MTNPKRTWSVSSASPSGLAYANGALFMAALRGKRPWRITLDGENVGHGQLPLQRHVRPAARGGEGARRERDLVRHHQRGQQRRRPGRLGRLLPLEPQPAA